jgi:hypothetical protein
MQLDAVYVFCCNAQSKLHSDLLDISRYLYSINFPTIICLLSMCYLSYGETPLVNCGPRSYFHYIAITCLLYSHCLLYLHTLLFSTRYAHTLCFKQTSEIDNLVASWEQSTWCVCAGSSLLLAKQSLDEVPYKLSEAITKLASITFGRLSALLLIDIPWFLT